MTTKLRIFLTILLCLVTSGIANAQTATLHGRVLDSRTGEPIARVTVSIREQKLETRTNSNGEFELTGIQAGEVEVHVTTVGYSLIRKKLDTQASTQTELEILLGPDVLKRTDEITVTEKTFVAPEPTSVSDHTITQAEIRNVSGVLIDDPVRVVQSLPGVASNDDFYAQFAARGAGFRSIGYSTDGVLLFAPFYEVGDVTNGASLAVLNSDVIEALTLSTGGFSSKYGDRTAGYLDIQTRNGNRQQFTNSAVANSSGIGWTSEGPIGRSQKASWLFSARKSYLGYLINKLSDDPSTTFAFGFYDFFGKVSYEPNVRHQLRFSGNFGQSRVDESRDRNFGPNDFLFGDSQNKIGTAKWFWIVTNRFTLDSTVNFDSTLLKNVNHDKQLLFDSRPRQFAFKQDAGWQPNTANKIEFGYFARRLDEVDTRRRFEFASQNFVASDLVSASAWQPGEYVQHTITLPSSKLSFTYGGRMDRFTATKQNVWMPRASVAWSPVSNTRLTLAFGQYSQFPTFFQLFGELRNSNLRAARATHYTFQFEQLLNDKTRIRVEAYDREDRDGVYSADTEYRLVNGNVVGPFIGIANPQWQNNLRGHSRGIELLLERRSVNKLSGWVSYSYGVARYRDAATNLQFDGDFDQRHTFNGYATYRVRPSLNLSTKYRYGTNFPVPGFLLLKPDSLTLLDQRNQSRVLPYSRLDARVNKSVTFDRFKLTLYFELQNVTGRPNHRFTTSSDIVNRFVSVDKDTMLPRLPLAGIRFEF
jgi:CarboxypepD_reg-like domain